MVVTIHNIVLKFIGTGLDNKYQACVNIYDTCNNLIYKNKTYNGTLNVCLKNNTLYKIKADLCSEQLNTFFYVTNNCDKYVFIFNRCILNNNTPKLKTITFLLNDANYFNLPIEKGLMFFDKNN